MRAVTAALVALAAAAPAAAQQHEGHAMQHGSNVPAMCMLPGGGAHGAGHGDSAGAQHAQGGMEEVTLWAHEFMMYAHHGAEFGLTDAQRTRIDQIRTNAQSSCTRHVQMAEQAKMAAVTAFGRANPDMAAFEAKLGEAAQHTTMAHVAIAKAALEAFEVLTPAQKEKALAERAEHTAQATGAAGHTGH